MEMETFMQHDTPFASCPHRGRRERDGVGAVVIATAMGIDQNGSASATYRSPQTHLPESYCAGEASTKCIPPSLLSNWPVLRTGLYVGRKQDI